MTNLEFYRQQAAQLESEAGTALLGNVRDRALSAALAWTKLGDRLERYEAAKAARVAVRASLLDEPSENPDRRTVPAAAVGRAPA
ncbi:MAG: hypothetical protein ACM3YM_12690 [Sphingomonadales bacterium]